MSTTMRVGPRSLRAVLAGCYAKPDRSMGHSPLKECAQCL